MAKGHIPLYALEERLGKLSRVVASRQKSGDIFHKIAARDAANASRIIHKLTTRYMILRGDGNGYASKKLYTKLQAQKLINRAERRGIDVYMSGPMKVSV